MGIWFTADTHLGHKNILHHCKKTRPFTSVEEMDDYIYEKWNTTVSKNDIVYHLGDFSFSPKTLRHLNGKLYLVAGNHDRYFINNPGKIFKEIYIGYHEIRIDNKMIVLSHYPIYEWNGAFKGSFHLHGHVHGNKMPIPGRIKDVGIDTNMENILYSYDEIYEEMLELPYRTN